MHRALLSPSVLGPDGKRERQEGLSGEVERKRCDGKDEDDNEEEGATQAEQDWAHAQQQPKSSPLSLLRTFLRPAAPHSPPHASPPAKKGSSFPPPTAASQTSNSSPQAGSSNSGSSPSPASPTTLRQRTISRLFSSRTNKRFLKNRNETAGVPFSLHLPSHHSSLISSGEPTSPLDFVSALTSVAPGSPVEHISSAPETVRGGNGQSKRSTSPVQRLKNVFQRAPQSPRIEISVAVEQDQHSDRASSGPSSPSGRAALHHGRRLATTQVDHEPAEFLFPRQPVESSPFFPSSSSLAIEQEKSAFLAPPVLPFAPTRRLTSPGPRRGHRQSSRHRSAVSARPQHGGKPPVSLNRHSSSEHSTWHTTSSSSDSVRGRLPSAWHPRSHPYLHRGGPTRSFSTFSGVSAASPSHSRPRLNESTPPPRPGFPQKKTSSIWPAPHLKSTFSDWTLTPPDSTYASPSPSQSHLFSASPLPIVPSLHAQLYRPLLSPASRRQLDKQLGRKTSAPALLDFASLSTELRPSAAPSTASAWTIDAPLVTGGGGMRTKSSTDSTLFNQSDAGAPSSSNRPRMTSVGVQAGEMVSVGVQSSPPPSSPSSLSSPSFSHRRDSVSGMNVDETTATAEEEHALAAGSVELDGGGSTWEGPSPFPPSSLSSPSALSFASYDVPVAYVGYGGPAPGMMMVNGIGGEGERAGEEEDELSERDFIRGEERSRSASGRSFLAW
ncbi:hypothetical protein JCM8547_008138 [Rhodosporidiobolus lusitaniae]